MAGLKNCYIFLCIDWKIVYSVACVGYENWVSCSESKKLNVLFLCVNLTQSVNLNFSNWYSKIMLKIVSEIDLDFNSISSIYTKMKILKI